MFFEPAFFNLRGYCCSVSDVLSCRNELGLAGDILDGGEGNTIRPGIQRIFASANESIVLNLLGQE